MINFLKAVFIVITIVVIGYGAYFVVIIGSIAIVIYGLSKLIELVER